MSNVKEKIALGTVFSDILGKLRRDSSGGVASTGRESDTMLAPAVVRGLSLERPPWITSPSAPLRSRRPSRIPADRAVRRFLTTERRGAA